MSRKQKDPPRPLSQEEHRNLKHLSRSTSQPAVHVICAKALLAGETSRNSTEAAKMAGDRMGETAAKLVNRLHQEGMSALQPGHGEGTSSSYGGKETERMLTEGRRVPEQTGRGNGQVVPLPPESERTSHARWLASGKHLHHLVRLA